MGLQKVAKSSLELLITRSTFLCITYVAWHITEVPQIFVDLVCFCSSVYLFLKKKKKTLKFIIIIIIGHIARHVGSQCSEQGLKETVPPVLEGRDLAPRPPGKSLKCLL